MIENIAMWGGVAGIVVAIVAVVILFLTRQNILNILNKDIILMDQNFEIKKQVMNSAFALVDEIAEKGDVVKSAPEFIQRAKQCYNDLLCVLSDVRIADEFQTLTLEHKHPYNIARLAQFKLMCRKDIGLKTSKSQAVKRALEQREAQQTQAQQMAQFQSAQSVQQPQVIQPVQPVQYVQPEPQTTPVQPTQSAQPHPVQQPRPMPQRPVPPVRPTPVQPTQPVNRVSRPRKEG